MSWLWWLWQAAFATENEPKKETLVTAAVVVAVSQQEAAADAVVAKATELGGWFQSRTDGALSLRVPSGTVETLVNFAEGQGKVLDKSLTRQDASVELADLRGRLLARQSLLSEYYKVLEEAGADSVVSVEYQIVAQIQEIEGLQGRIRMLEDQASNARVDVAFQFRDRAAPARDGSSSFRWLNSLNVQDVIWSLQSSQPDHRTKGVRVPKPPDGFSAWRKKGRYRAASANDVLFRVRTERHKPKGELSFWKEAVRVRMLAAGYKLVEEKDLGIVGVNGATIELVAPVGTEDWTYLIGFFPVGGRIVVAEAAGEVTRFEARREQILTAMKDIVP
jgi:hypothetical protein